MEFKYRKQYKYIIKIYLFITCEQLVTIDMWKSIFRNLFIKNAI